MRPHLKIALVAGALALSAAPAMASGGPPSSVPPSNQGTAHAPSHNGGPPSDVPPTGGNSQGNGPDYSPQPPTPGPNAGLPAQVKAYGRYCQDESKEHVDGQPGTPFSQCVLAMAKLATGNTTNPAKACKNESKTHVKGEQGAPFSRCVSAAAKLRHSQQQG